MIWWAAMLDFFVSLPKEPAITISKHRIKSIKPYRNHFQKFQQKNVHNGNMDFKRIKTQKMDPFQVHPFSAFFKKVTQQCLVLHLDASACHYWLLVGLPTTWMHMGGSKNGATPKWMKIIENPIKWMIWGYPYFWKHPSTYIYIYIYTHIHIYIYKYTIICWIYPWPRIQVANKGLG